MYALVETAAEQATRSIPIVFAVVNDPVEQGLIASLAHPGGNVTDLSFVTFPCSANRWSCSAGRADAAE
jgi:putative tryptophan/tyrosine transport system substrate-binding protein